MSGVSLQEEASEAGALQAVLVSVDDLEGPEMILEILGDTDAGRISRSLAALRRGEPSADLAART
jgi:antitoxin YefM